MSLFYNDYSCIDQQHNRYFHKFYSFSGTMNNFLSEFHPKWNEFLDTDFKDLTMSDKQRYRVYFYFHVFANKCMNDAEQMPEAIENIRTHQFNDSEYYQVQDINELHTTFESKQRLSRDIMKNQIQHLLGIKFDFFPCETPFGDEEFNTEAVAASANSIANLPEYEIQTLRIIGNHLKEFTAVSNDVIEQINALPQTQKKSSFFIETEEIICFYDDFKDDFNALYVDFLGDSGSFQ